MKFSQPLPSGLVDPIMANMNAFMVSIAYGIFDYCLKQLSFFSKAQRQHFGIKKFGGQRQDKAGKDRIINLFLETGKSAVEF